MDNNTAISLFARADALYRKGHYEEALSALREIVLFFPHNKAVLYAMALCLERLNRRQEAMQLCDRLVQEYHDDNAMILKARLITEPGDPLPEMLQEEIALGWPHEKDVFSAEDTTPAPSIPPHASFLMWYGISAVFIMAFFALLMMYVVLFAQADTNLPGALPTLFPGRLLAGYFCTVVAATTIMVLCGIGTSRETITLSPMVFLKSACAGILFFIPVLGWLLACALLRRWFVVTLLRIFTIWGMVFLFQLLAAMLVAHLLGLANSNEIYMELKAGYG